MRFQFNASGMPNRAELRNSLGRNTFCKSARPDPVPASGEYAQPAKSAVGESTQTP